jgi:hypothetical protein
VEGRIHRDDALFPYLSGVLNIYYLFVLTLFCIQGSMTEEFAYEAVDFPSRMFCQLKLLLR